MRDRETIDSELRRVAGELRSIRERGGRPSSRQLDALLDERLGHPADALCDLAILDEICLPAEQAGNRLRRRRRGLLLRLALRAAVPLSLITFAAVVLVTFVLHHRHPTAQPTVTSQPDVQASPAAAAQPPFIPPAKPASPTDIADKALIDTLQHEGLPVPGHDYVATQGHAVCDFLARQPNVGDAAHFVQQSTVWDAGQSADFVSAAVIIYCPQFESTASDQMQQTYQKSLTDLQRIQGDLRGINQDLEGISDGLHGGS